LSPPRSIKDEQDILKLPVPKKPPKLTSRRIGIHTSTAGGVQLAAERAYRLGCNTFQIFSSSPRQWKPYLLSRSQCDEMRSLRKKYGIKPLVIHTNYLVNLAGTNPEFHAKSIEAFRAELERALALGAEYLVLHPGSFRGSSREEGLDRVAVAIDHESLELVEEYADVIQIGARNMQNFSLLKRAGRSKKPVLLKRGLAATLEELLMAAEYVMSEGNYNVILCERGVRTFVDHARNTLDLSIVPAVQKLSHLPIIVDPSHGTGQRNKVIPLSRAAVAVGADGLIVEVHNDPDHALSDGAQSLFPDQFEQLMKELRQIAAILHRDVPSQPAQPPRPQTAAVR